MKHAWYISRDINTIKSLCEIITNNEKIKYKLFIVNPHKTINNNSLYFRLKNGYYYTSINEIIQAINYFAIDNASIQIKFYDLYNKCFYAVTFDNYLISSN